MDGAPFSLHGHLEGLYLNTIFRRESEGKGIEGELEKKGKRGKGRGNGLEKKVKSPNLIDRAKKGFDEAFHRHKSPRHHKETHGTSNDIDDNTPVESVKGPNVFQRVKEEVEAIVEAVHSKKDSKDHK
ncbi:hypothetical protein KSS87_008938 [Heliosperma pusillum]|nr:hypothetical protein KSS87_008938 [Heliosperma pusillum]